MTHRSKGFLLPTVYIALGAALAFGGVLTWGWVQTQRLGTLQREFAAFQAKVQAEGEVAAAQAQARAESDKLRKEAADAENAAALATLAATVGRLRRDASRNPVPAAPAGTSRPDLACFDRAELERALGQYRADVRGLVDEGSAATLNLDTAKRWAQR